MYPGVRQVPHHFVHCVRFPVCKQECSQGKGSGVWAGSIFTLVAGLKVTKLFWAFSPFSSCCLTNLDYCLLKEMYLPVMITFITWLWAGLGPVGYCPADSLAVTCSGNLLVHSWMINFSYVWIWGRHVQDRQTWHRIYRKHIIFWVVSGGKEIQNISDASKHPRLSYCIEI